MNTYFYFLSIKTCHNKKRHSDTDKKSFANIIEFTKRLAFCTRAALILFSGIRTTLT